MQPGPADHQETWIIKRMVPGTSSLFGMGRSTFGELWRDEENTTTTTTTMKPLGREFKQVTKLIKVRDGGYSVEHGDEQWLMSQGQRHIKQIACGSLHMILLEFNGKCWALGGNERGQLGLGHSQRTKYPTLINGQIKNLKIECVRANGWFSAFLSTTGKVFTCGNIARKYWDDVTQSAYSSDENNRATTQCVPRAVIMDSHMNRISKMGSGKRFLLMQEQHTMNMYRLGQPNSHLLSKDQIDPNVSLMHYIHPLSLERGPINFECKKIDAGEMFSVLLDYQGNLFTTGIEREYTREESLFNRKVHVLDVCCSWTRYIALDASGHVHIGNTETKENVITLLSLGPMTQIGSSCAEMYARVKNTIYRLRSYSDDNEAPKEVPFETEMTLDEAMCVQMTGSYFTTIVHQAVQKKFLLDVNGLRLRQFLCDVTVTCQS